MNRKILPLLLIALLFMACSSTNEEDSELSIGSVAEDYVKLVLRAGLYDPDFVDAYYGPESLRPEPVNHDDSLIVPYDELKWEAVSLIEKIERLSEEERPGEERQRLHNLRKQLKAVYARITLLAGENLPFDKETKMIYDAVAPAYPASHYDSLLGLLDEALPGSGELNSRYLAFVEDFIIPIEKLDTVFKATINEARNRTLTHLTLPEEENFTVKYVTDKPWLGYNWYQGNSYSLIQLNTDLPIYIERAIDLASHEGYPGHHVFNVLIEQNLVKQKGWIEYSVYPLFSPLSLIAEGSANYGIKVAFPGDERLRFETRVLYPLAGIDPEKATRYHTIRQLRENLDYAQNEAARRFLSGELNRDEAVEWIMKYNLYSEKRARQRVDFIERYRSYVINYNYGQDLVARWIERQGGTADNPGKRWELFRELLSFPQTASQLTD